MFSSTVYPEKKPLKLATAHQTPIRTWFWLIYLMASQRTGFSILSFFRIADIHYQTAWTRAHKIRAAMQQRDARYLLCGLVELDDSYFGTKRSGKRGRGAEGRRPVLVGASIRGKGPAHAVMRILLDVSAFPSGRKLPWVYVLLANVKGMLRGVHHGVSRKHLQPYLSGFCWHFSCRFFEAELFDRLLWACVCARPPTYREPAAQEVPSLRLRRTTGVILHVCSSFPSINYIPAPRLFICLNWC